MNALIYLQVISTQKIIFQGNVTVARFPGKKSAEKGRISTSIQKVML